MKEVALDWKKVIAVWWLLLWRALLGSALIGGAIGAVIGFAWGMFGLNASTLQILTSAIGVVVGVVWGAIVVRMALGKRYKGFRLALVEA